MNDEGELMKGHPSYRSFRTSMDLRYVFVALAFLFLAACGGSSSNDNGPSNQSSVTISISPQSLSVSATTTQSAPTDTFQVNVTGLNQGQDVYILWSFSTRGITNVTAPSGGTLPATITIQFQSPATLGAGTFNDTVQVKVCFDQACTQPLQNSPQNVQVQYTVTKSTFAITGLSPTSAYAGAQSFTLTVNGSTFTAQSTVLWNGTQLETTFINSSQLTAQVPAADITTVGDASVSVSDPMNGTSNAVNITINPSPITITSLSPASINAEGPGFTLTLTGTSFTSQSTVLWNGNPQTTNFVSATQLTAQIPATDISTPGSAFISVSDPTFGISNTQSFTINNPPLALFSVSPMTVTVGGPSFTLTALGTSFTGTSSIEWNGAALTTTLVSSTELLAQVPASDINTTGTASVIVSDPNSPPGTTGAQTITIAPPSIDAVAYQMNAEHNGAVNFSSVSFPSNPTWSVDVGGTPSYALIADGKVIVTVEFSYNSSEVLAMDQATGNIVWGPIMFASVAAATYENGKVFVLSGSNLATLEALDVNTGTLDWSTQLAGRYVFSGIPTATDGTVYAVTEGTMNAVSESTGTVLWTKYASGVNPSPAVTVDGVYTAYYCQTSDLRPATGEIIWLNNIGCSGGGGSIAQAINQLLYSNDALSGYGGDIFFAETGASAGTYAADASSAFTTTMGYIMNGGTLFGVLLSNNNVQWSFTGDGQLVGAPIAVNQYVFICSQSGNLYAVDSSTGNQVWTVNLGTPIGGNPDSLPYTGLAAGDGLLIVPAGTTVTAYTLSTNP